MLKAIKISEAVGKTFTGVEISWNGQMVIMFTDSFVTLSVVHGGDATIEEQELRILDFDFNDNKIIGLGIVTREELQNLRQIET